MRATLLVPTWNEIDGMRAVMPRVPRGRFDQILVVDAGSTDGTVEYARAEGYEVHVQRARGIRKAYAEAWPLVRGDVVATFSPDGNSDPDRIGPLLDEMEKGFDMVIVSRYAPGAHSDDDGLVTGFGNWFFNRAINAAFGARYTDSFVMFRAYKRDLPIRLGIFDDSAYQPMERWFRTVAGCEPLISIRAAKCGLRVGEIPGDEPPRIGGTAKLQVFRWGATYLGQVVKERLAP